MNKLAQSEAIRLSGFGNSLVKRIVDMENNEMPDVDNTTCGTVINKSRKSKRLVGDPVVQKFTKIMTNHQNTLWMRAGCPTSDTSLRKYTKI